MAAYSNNVNEGAENSVSKGDGAENSINMDDLDWLKFDV